MPCTKIVTCDNNLSALEAFLMCVLIADSGCPVINTTSFESDGNCSLADCNKTFTLEEVIKSIAITENGNSISIASVLETLQDRITCDDIPALLTLINEVFSNSLDSCPVVRTYVTTTDEDCSNIQCADEPLLSIILRTFMKSSDSGCTVVLVAETDVSDVIPYTDCTTNKESFETVLRKLLVPSSQFAGHFAWVVPVQAIVVASFCYTFFIPGNVAGYFIERIDYSGGSTGAINIDLIGLSNTQIGDAIAAALLAVGITVNGVDVLKTVLGGVVFNYTITIKMPVPIHTMDQIIVNDGVSTSTPWTPVAVGPC